MRSKKIALCIIFLFVISALSVFILPVHAGSLVATNATGCASCSSKSLTFLNVLVGDTFVLGAWEGPSTHFPNFGTTSNGEVPVGQHDFGFSGNDGAYSLRISTFTALSSGTDTITASYTDTTASFFVAIELRGFSTTKTAAVDNGPNGHEWTGTISTIPANAFVIAVALTTDSAAQSWSIAAGNSPGGVLVADTNHWKGASEYVCCTPPTSFNFDLQATTGTFTGGSMLDFAPSAGGGGTIGLDVTILNMDLGNYLVVPYNKFYNFNETAIGVHASNVDLVKWKWTDGASTAEVQYSNLTKTATVLQGNNIIFIGTPTATSSIVGGQKKLQVIIPVRLSENALDTTGVSINAYSQLADGTTTGYLVVRSRYFNIFNQGGTASQQISGTCAPAPLPSGYFSALCQKPGWIMTNTTWFQLQSYHTEFAINLNDAFGNPNTFLWQDYGNSNAGAENFTSKGDWKVDIGWFYFNGGAWMKGFHMTLEMNKGNQGVQDQWTQVRVLFYNRNTLVGNGTSNILNAWIEQSPRSQIRLYVDLWISKLNASSLHAMRVGAYYYGIHQSGFTFFGSWSPFLQNASSTAIFSPNLDNNGKNIDMQAVQFHKLYWNISRGHTSTGQTNFQIYTRDYNLEQFKTTKGRMEGVDTPIFVDAKIPTLPIDGFFAPLYAAITSIGDLIWAALAAAFSAIWAQIGIRFPWFTGFWDVVGANVVNFANLFIVVMGQLGGFLSFLFSIASFITYPIQIVVNTWNILAGIYNTLFVGNNMGQIIGFFIILIFGLSILEASVTGDWPFIVNLTRQTWRIADAIMRWTYWFARVLIDAILAIIP